MLEDIVYRASQILIAVSSFILNLMLALLYWGKGKTVPIIRNPLLKKSASKLAQEIREGKLKSEDVVLAYIDRILEVEPFINATVSRFFKDALEQARAADALVASGNYSQEQLANEKPLLGVPFTVKVLFHVKGLPCTGASKLFEDQIATEDAAVISLMKGAGAILIATTNSAELAMGIETVNKIYGRTCNPYDTNRTPGGSSGGESALIAAGGSVIGIGNDFMGSIRIPAHCTGIFAHKPTRGLIPTKGSFPPEYPDKPPQPIHALLLQYVSVGPLCRYAEDLRIATKILSSEAELKWI
ncbi:Fatty-acid amide hydrolase 2 like protein [Argiope bruennichi]|uniref:Fatty-acid amide hydrolase 2 like protein n=1 Tax=Argiope bruennichi TaxID=94029 RepID=A0A8T0EEC7_ARGBR|nr:Fatty-acid amide hydrolase 2 like protein [Argiope bruennichi]